MNWIVILATFFGWSTVINAGICLLTVVSVVTLRGFVQRINARIFRIGEEDGMRMAVR